MDDDGIRAVLLESSHIVIGSVVGDGVMNARDAAPIGDLRRPIGKMDRCLALGHGTFIVCLLFVRNDDVRLAGDRAGCRICGRCSLAALHRSRQHAQRDNGGHGERGE